MFLAISISFVKSTYKSFALVLTEISGFLIDLQEFCIHLDIHALTAIQILKTAHAVAWLFVSFLVLLDKSKVKILMNLNFCIIVKNYFLY